jgi:hypothetical protein
MRPYRHRLATAMLESGGGSFIPGSIGREGEMSRSIAVQLSFHPLFPLLSCVLALLTSIGCVSDKKSPPTGPSYGSGRAIDEINVLAFPVAVDVDQVSGPDGFALKVYASGRHSPKPVTIDEGKLDLFMFDGAFGLGNLEREKPLRTWTFTADQLKAFKIQTSIGVGYQLAPLWGQSKPTGSKFTVVIRYSAPNAQPVISEPSIISMGAR